ncbi:hypothetical protein OH687_02685 [Burkholderia anthina]|nr:hypothetical protein OH687_02685 [Burkholderia anthina]
MVQGTNFPFRDAEKRSAIQNDENNQLFLKGNFCFEKSLYAHHSSGART